MRKPLPISTEHFKALLKAGKIRPASLEDCYGTHHKRPLYLHPITKQPFVTILERNLK